MFVETPKEGSLRIGRCERKGLHSRIAQTVEPSRLRLGVRHATGLAFAWIVAASIAPFRCLSYGWNHA